MLTKRILDADRVRKITGGFSFIPHRFLADGFLASLDREELLLYLFLILAGERRLVFRLCSQRARRTRRPQQFGLRLLRLRGVHPRAGQPRRVHRRPGRIDREGFNRFRRSHLPGFGSPAPPGDQAEAGR